MQELENIMLEHFVNHQTSNKTKQHQMKQDVKEYNDNQNNN